MKRIKYSISERTVKWGDHAGEKRYTANLQTTGIMSLDEFAEHMADHDCKYNKGDIYSVLTQAAICIREMLLSGAKISLGDIGVISPKIKQKAAKNRDEFSANNITDLYAKITIGKALKDMRPDASFENVPTLANQALLIAAEREGANTVSLVKPTAGSGGSGTSPNPSQGGGSEQATVAAPTFSGATQFTETTQVTMSGPAGASIFYTVDGSTPTDQSLEYEEPITLSATTTVKAIAIKDGISSAVTSRTYSKVEGGGDDASSRP